MNQEEMQGTTQDSPENKRILYFDLLNIAACFFVVVLHFNVSSHWYYESPKYLFSLFCECAFYWPVPIFLMLSGATLMRYRERYDTKTFFKKRLARVLVPFLAWSLLLIPLQVELGLMEAPIGPRSLVTAIFQTKVMQVYWFFTPLFAIYLAMPVLSCMTDDKFRRPLWYAVIVGFVTSAVLPPLCALFGIGYNSNLIPPLFTGFGIFPVLGYLTSTTDFSKRQRYVIYALGILSIVIRFFVIYLGRGVADEGKPDYAVLWSYTSFAGVLPGLAVFVGFKHVRWKFFLRNPKALKIVATASSCSFGIYLIHMIPIEFCEHFIAGVNYTVPWILFGAPVTYTLCLLVVWAVRHAPVLRRLFP